MKKFLACALALLMMGSAAMAAGRSYEGAVVATQTAAVLAPAAGTIGEVLVQAGQRVSRNAEVAALTSTTVYAEQSGTVKVFGSVGESVATLTTRYGAVVYIEPDCHFTVSGSTGYAYDSPENKLLHPGETVYLRASGDYTHVAEGTVTAVSGTKFTVEIVGGTLASGDVAYIYRDAAYTTTKRVGRGTVTRVDPLVMTTSTGTGVVSAIHVADGQRVEPGTPLFTSVEAPAYSWQMLSPESGVVTSVSVAAGDTVEAGALIAQIAPDSALRLEVIVEARDLRSIKAGDLAQITFDNGVTATGAVERISGVPYAAETESTAESTTETAAEDDAVYYAVYVAFSAGQSVPCGMTARVTIGQ